MSDAFAAARPVDVGALGAAMSGMRADFAELGLESLARADADLAPAEPKHFRPAHPGFHPTAGWDPFDPLGEKAKSPSPPPPAPMPDADPAADALDAARAEGFAEGLAAGERIAATRAEADAEALARIEALLAERSAADRDLFAARLRQTVLHLVGRIVGEAGIEPQRMAERVEAAARLLADVSETATLRLHPADLALLQGRLPAGMLAIADATLDRGGFRLENRSGAIEDGPAAWLAQLAAAIDRAPLPVP